MLEFAWPWLWLLAPLPFLVRAFMPPATGVSKNALNVPFIEQMEKAVVGQSNIVGRKGYSGFILAFVVWLLLVAAATKPQWLGEPIPQQLEGRDLVLAVDLSESMFETDFELNGQLINRLVATRIVAGDFIERRQGDRVGLILFGEQAYVQAPLTHDRETVKTLLDEAQIGLAGKSTAIGDAIGLAVKRFQQSDSKQRVLILLTDGTNNAGVLAPTEAAELAAKEGLKIYTIGVGADTRLGLLNSLSSFNSYIQASSPTSNIDETTLTSIAEKTGGKYFRARDIDQLAEIYELLDELEPIAQDNEFFRPIDPLYHWPLIAGLLLGLLWLMLLSNRVGRG
ncbi:MULTISPECIES: VWA domain-containing protein [unclassified Neptuniibacter]|jgi:Ca-activated chloride channel family protein|uniref:vWA domain-containing protein n=1 Tax=unclassified Neptuniibacter TaxID=2630693 RepID=UPI0026E453A7|nr:MULTISPECIES: VWA domain-containing protein [unclassified Neptuniibacter]MDO6515377.1 VWA domain-containing protein [Neptuniibacter sp. 2_MG-2023]MDO6594703.1 VWA domain-containing protein [Neptuniibacter sp. 1_MG-2023]